jgi:hypothetical protein
MRGFARSGYTSLRQKSKSISKFCEKIYAESIALNIAISVALYKWFSRQYLTKERRWKKNCANRNRNFLVQNKRQQAEKSIKKIGGIVKRKRRKYQ